MRLRQGLLVAACGLAIMAAGCGKGDGPTAPGDTPRTSVRNDTPKALLETAHEAFQKKDMAVLPKLVNPAAAEPFRAMMEMMTEMQTTGKEVSATVKGKLGAEHAEKLGGMGADEGMESPLAKAAGEDGTVDWNRVKITIDGDTAKYEIDGKAEGDTVLRKIDGRWYVDFADMTPEQMKKQVDEMRPQVEKRVKAMRTLEEHVKAGVVTAENFDEKWLELLTAETPSED